MIERAQAMMAADWLDLGPVEQIPLRGARSVPVAGGEELAVFRTGDDRVYALVNRCPHKGGPLAQGIVHGDKVACPLHDWKISLVTGEAMAPDQGCVPTIPVRVIAGRILILRAAVIKQAA
jgi:nitrite reductase (NADH) small subunit